MSACEGHAEIFELLQQNDERSDALLLEMLSGKIKKWAKSVLRKYGREPKAHKAWHDDMFSVGNLKIWRCLRGDPESLSDPKLDRSQIECEDQLIGRLFLETINAMHKELREFLKVVPLKHLTVPSRDDTKETIKVRVISLQDEDEPEEQERLFERIDHLNAVEYFTNADRLIELLHNQLRGKDHALIKEMARAARRRGRHINIAEVSRKLKLAESTVRSRLEALRHRVLEAADEELREEAARVWRMAALDAA